MLVNHDDVDREYSVAAGQVQLAQGNQTLSARVESGLALVIQDRSLGVAGLAHVMLPDSHGACSTAAPGKFADWAVRFLVDRLVQHGAQPGRLWAMVAGGADREGEDLGRRNLDAAMLCLANHGIAIREQDLGGRHARQVSFSPGAGLLRVERLAPSEV